MVKCTFLIIFFSRQLAWLSPDQKFWFAFCRQYFQSYFEYPSLLSAVHSGINLGLTSWCEQYFSSQSFNHVYWYLFYCAPTELSLVLVSSGIVFKHPLFLIFPQFPSHSVGSLGSPFPIHQNFPHDVAFWATKQCCNTVPFSDMLRGK